MTAVQAGDGDAYRVLLASITPYLRSLARRSGLPPDEIEDGVQDVLLTLHAIRHSFDPSRPFAPWLVVVARHRLTDRLRRGGRRARHETPLTAAHETFSADETNHYEDGVEARLLRAAIARLPAGQRQAVELLKLEELSLAEASAASGQSIAALKVSMHRALKRLRRMLVGEEG